MPGKKRSRWDGEGGEEGEESVTEVQKRTRGLHEDNNGHDEGLENGIAESGYLHKVMDKGSRGCFVTIVQIKILSLVFF